MKMELLSMTKDNAATNIEVFNYLMHQDVYAHTWTNTLKEV